MKKTSVIIMLVLTTVALLAQNQDRKARIKEVTLKTEMDCSACENKVRQELTYTRGVIDIETNIENNTVVVKYRTRRTDVSKIIESLSENGIEAKEKTAKKSCNVRVPSRSCCLY